MSGPLTTVVFDLGNVLLDWDPRRLFGELIDDPEELDHFLDTICTPGLALRARTAAARRWRRPLSCNSSTRSTPS